MTNFTQPTKLPHVCSEADLSHNFKFRTIVVESDIQTVLLTAQLPCSQNLTEVWVVSVLACKHVIICNGWNGLGFVFFPCLYRFSNECDDHAVTFVKPVPTIFQYLHLYLCQRIFRRQRKCRHFGSGSGCWWWQFFLFPFLLFSAAKYGEQERPDQGQDWCCYEDVSPFF